MLIEPAARPSRLPRRPSRSLCVPTDGYHLPGRTWGNELKSLHKVARRTRNIKHDRCRTPDDSTAEDEHSDHNRTIPATRQAPAWAPFTFQGLSCELRHAAHGRFVKARPARPTSTRLRSRRAHQSPSGGSIVAQTKTHAGPRRRMARKDWRNHGARDEMRGTRGQPGPRRVDDGDRDAGVHGRRAGTRRTTSFGRERLTRTGSEGSSWCRGRQRTPTSSRGAAGNDGGDRPGSRPRPGTRGSLETRGDQARPRGRYHCASESGSYRQRQASGCYRKPAPTINSRVP